MLTRDTATGIARVDEGADRQNAGRSGETENRELKLADGGTYSQMNSWPCHMWQPHGRWQVLLQ